MTLAVGALVALVLALSGLLSPVPASAAGPDGSLTITLTSMTPALPTRDGTVTLTGQVSNSSAVAVQNLQAILWRSRDPLRTSEALTRALASQPDDPIGERLYQRDYQNIPSDKQRSLGPGQSTSFTLTTDVANLDLPRADGVYLFGVQVRGRTAADGQDRTLGRARTFLPLIDKPPAKPLRMTSVVLLTSRPSIIRPGLVSDEHLAGEVAPRGRLTALLDAAESKNLTFAVDPALLDELRILKAGYQVRTAEGGTIPGVGQAEATRWLEDFARVRAATDGYRLLYGSPDVAALVHDGQTGILTDAADASRVASVTSGLPLLVLPAAGTADRETVQAAEDLQPAALVLSDTTAAGLGPLLAGPGTAPIVSFTAAAFGPGPGPEPSGTAIQVQQRMLAETWVEASTAADGAAHGRVRLVTTAVQARGDDAGVAAPWIQRSTLTELLSDTPATWDQKFRYPAAAQAAELTPGQLSSLERLRASQQTYADLLVKPGAVGTDAAAAAARAASWTWRRADKARRSWLGPQQDVLDEILTRKISISSTPKVSTVAREGVEFPITIKNGLEASANDPDANAVNVRLQFTSDNSQRLSIKTIDAPEIAAGGTVTANAEVRARANGTVPVTAQLVTDSGRKVGQPFAIDVQVTQNGTTGWAIVILSGIVLLGSTSLRIRQVARDRARAASTAGDRSGDTPSGLSSAPPTVRPASSDSASGTLDV